MSAIILLVYVVSRWMIFEKLGRAGWESLIPFYSTYVICEVLYGNGMRVFFICIPFLNIYFLIKLCMDLAVEFGKSKSFGLGILFFPYIFYCIILLEGANINSGANSQKVNETVEKIREAIRTEKRDKTEKKENEFSDLSSKLNSLKSMKENGLIDEAEYNEKREALFEAYRKI